MAKAASSQFDWDQVPYRPPGHLSKGGERSGATGDYESSSRLKLKQQSVLRTSYSSRILKKFKYWGLYIMRRGSLETMSVL